MSLPPRHHIPLAPALLRSLHLNSLFQDLTDLTAQECGKKCQGCLWLVSKKLSAGGQNILVRYLSDLLSCQPRWMTTSVQVSLKGHIKCRYLLVWFMRWASCIAEMMAIDGLRFVAGWSCKDPNGATNWDVRNSVGILSAVLHEIVQQGLWPLPVYSPSQIRDKGDGNRIQNNVLLARCEGSFYWGLVWRIHGSCPTV